MSKRLLVTGHHGYIGSVMAPYLLSRGYDVVGLDAGYFGECTLVRDTTTIPEIRKDLRDVVPADLESFDAVIHLAALSNDPIGNLDEQWTDEINYEASVRLAELAREANVRRFIFSSSCIMYGMAEAETVDEMTPLDPRTAYARSKVKAEVALRELARDGFSPVFLRNGTVYGVSPRMRFDTVLNDMVGSAVARGRVVVRGDGTPWRPVVHVEDVARVFLAVLEAPVACVHNETFNNGADHLNKQVIELARTAANLVPDCQLEVLERPGVDRRTYKAAFDKFARAFPDFRFKWSVESGARQLASTLARIGLTVDDYRSDKFIRLRWLNRLLDEGRLDQGLRWRSPASADV